MLNKKSPGAPARCGVPGLSDARRYESAKDPASHVMPPVEVVLATGSYSTWVLKIIFRNKGESVDGTVLE